jgi:hypothetical protein
VESLFPVNTAVSIIHCANLLGDPFADPIGICLGLCSIGISLWVSSIFGFSTFSLRSARRRLPCIYHACPQDYPVGAVLLNSQDGAGGAPRWAEAFESSGMLRCVAAANTPTHGVLSSGGKILHLFPLRSA